MGPCKDQGSSQAGAAQQSGRSRAAVGQEHGSSRAGAGQQSGRGGAAVRQGRAGTVKEPDGSDVHDSEVVPGRAHSRCLPCRQPLSTCACTVAPVRAARLAAPANPSPSPSSCSANLYGHPQ